MSYVSLYRKWRSQNFDEIIGQKVIVQTLKNAIQFNRLAHAYLFAGPRGTGKTSTARILAKALNCQAGPTVTPCGQCDNCQKIKSGHSVDVIEIDAASNRGIDEIRELRERVRYTPLEGRYKIYIIDEVHMLTPEAFNALLKTLEEPPSHIIFVLATTELQKVPATIASRCQRLDFERIKLAELKEHLQAIADKEGFTIEAKALDLIGRTAEGGMRDAISLLDQVVSFSGQKIGYDDVVTLLGTADEEFLFGFGEAVASVDIKQVLELIRQGIDEGRSIPQVTRDLVYHFRNLLHLKVGSGEALELTSEYLQRLEVQAAKYNLEKIKAMIRALSRAELDMKWHPHPRLVLEVALLESLEEGAPAGQPDVVAYKEPAATSPVRAQPGITKPEVSKLVPAKVEIPLPGKTALPKNELNDSVSPGQHGFEKIQGHWEVILDSMRKKSIYGYVSLHEGEPIEVDSHGRLVIGFRKGYSFHKERLEEAKNKVALEESIREVLGHKIGIECIITDKTRSPVISANAVAEYFEGKMVS